MTIPRNLTLRVVATVVILSCVVLTLQQSEPCGPPAEFGGTYTLTAAINDSFKDGMTWKLNHTLQVIEVASCFPYIRTTAPHCDNAIDDEYVATIEMVSNGEYLINLTILEAITPRDEADWFWTAGDPPVEYGRCHLKFYSLPIVSLTNCPNQSDPNAGFIKEGTNETCECVITHPGLPPGRAVWSSDSGQTPIVVGSSRGNSSDNQSSILFISYNSSEPSPTYNCRGESTYGSGNPISFSPRFTYGPKFVYISIENATSTLKLCHDSADPPSIEVYCDIYHNEAVPGVGVQVQLENYTFSSRSGDDHNDTSTNGTPPNGWFVFDLLIPREGGNFTPRCVASNSIYSEINSSASTQLEVLSPPLSPPTISILNIKGPRILDNDIVTVSSGSILEMRCNVNGGFPKVSNTTIKCGNISKSTNGDESNLALNISADMNLATCSCYAFHVTECYGKRRQFALDVKYDPEITHLKVTNNQSSSTINAGTAATLTCVATGNSRPSLTLQANRTSKFLPVKHKNVSHSLSLLKDDFQAEVYVTKIFECSDTDVYLCTAENEFGKVYSNLAVSVVCPPELQPLETSIETLTLADDKLSISVPVLGHPKPYMFSMVRQAQCPSEMVNGVLPYVPVDRSLYKVIYLPGNSPYGTVHVEMDATLNKGEGIYRLSIDNGVASALKYTFYVTDPTKGKITEDDNDVVVIAVVVSIVIILITNVIVAAVFYIIGRRMERKANNEKKEPQIQYRITPPPPIDGGERNQSQSPPSPDAYVDIDFSNIDIPPSSNSRPQPEQHNRPVYSSLNARQSARTPYTAMAPPGNLYIYEVPTQRTQQQQNNIPYVNHQDVYVNNNNSTSGTDDIYERLRDSAVLGGNNPTKSTTRDKVETLKTLPRKKEMELEAVENTYNEIPSPSSPDNNDNNVYYQIPSNIKKEPNRQTAENVYHQLKPKEDSESQYISSDNPPPKILKNEENTYSNLALSETKMQQLSRPSRLDLSHNETISLHSPEYLNGATAETESQSIFGNGVYNETSPKYEETSSIFNPKNDPHSPNNDTYAKPSKSSDINKQKDSAISSNGNKTNYYDSDVNHYMLPSPQCDDDNDGHVTDQVTYMNMSCGDDGDDSKESPQTKSRVKIGGKNGGPSKTGTYEQVDVDV